MKDHLKRLDEIFNPLDGVTWLALKELSHEERVVRLREIVLGLAAQDVSDAEDKKVDGIISGHVGYLLAAIYEKNREAGRKARQPAEQMMVAVRVEQLKEIMEIYTLLPSDNKSPHLKTREKLLTLVVRRWAESEDEAEADELCRFLVEAAKCADQVVHHELISRLIRDNNFRADPSRRARMMLAMVELSKADVHNDVCDTATVAFAKDLAVRHDALAGVARIVNAVGIEGERVLEWELVSKYTEWAMRTFAQPARELEGRLCEIGAHPWKMTSLRADSINGATYTFNWPGSEGEWTSKIMTEKEAIDNAIKRALRIVEAWRAEGPQLLAVRLTMIRPGRGGRSPEVLHNELVPVPLHS